MTLTDEQIRALLRDPSKAPPCARHLGFELIDYSVDGGWAEVAFSPRAEFANPAGAVQGGFVCAMLDDTMSVAASISQRFAVIVPTLQTSVSYLNPTPIARVVAKGATLIHEPVITPWGDRNVRLSAPDGLQITLFQVPDEQ